MAEHHVRIRGVERAFDPQRYASLVIALAKELARSEPPEQATKKATRNPEDAA